jgi:hypothetical protein
VRAGLRILMMGLSIITIIVAWITGAWALLGIAVGFAVLATIKKDKV